MVFERPGRYVSGDWQPLHNKSREWIYTPTGEVVSRRQHDETVRGGTLEQLARSNLEQSGGVQKNSNYHQALTAYSEKYGVSKGVARTEADFKYYYSRLKAERAKVGTDKVNWKQINRLREIIGIDPDDFAEYYH